MMAKNTDAPAVAKIVLTRPRRIRGKDYKPDTVMATLTPAAGFNLDDLRKVLTAGHVVLAKG